LPIFARQGGVAIVPELQFATIAEVVHIFRSPAGRLRPIFSILDGADAIRVNIAWIAKFPLTGVQGPVV
jgi:hypothetical protein